MGMVLCRTENLPEDITEGDQEGQVSTNKILIAPCLSTKSRNRSIVLSENLGKKWGGGH